MLVFGSFRLDSLNQQLWQEQRLIAVPPKTFAVLRYLVERPQRLVTKRELLDALWGDVCVGDAVLKTHLNLIRQILGDSVKAPRFIETAHGRGYRFVASIEHGPAFPGRSPASTSASKSAFVGREAELARLTALLATARTGQRGLAFVTGEPGIGKTALVHAFVSSMPPALGEVWIARGQCIEQYGAGATFLPILEILSSLCRGPDASTVVEVLRRYGPTWLVQMPELLDEPTRAALERTSGVATPERSLREMAATIAALTEVRPLVWVLEDLQWADYSTLDLVSYLARRSEPVRLLVVCTYRPIEIRLPDHPLRSLEQSLALHEQCEEVALRHLGEADLVLYLEARFPGHRFPKELPRLLQQRTAGNPLFIARVVDDCLKRGWISQASGVWLISVELDALTQSVPTSILTMIERETERLSPFERQVLEVASVVGYEFSALSVAAATAEDVVRIEELCERWARHGPFLKPGRSERSVAESRTYRFIHALYHQVVYFAIGQERRVRWHQCVGEHLEASREDPPQAAALASHFERARDVRRALAYRRLAGDQALSRSACPQAVAHFRAALELCEQLPVVEGKPLELQLQVALGVPLAMTLGYAAPEVETCYVRAASLCQELEETPSFFPVLSGLATFYLMRGRYQESARIGSDFLALALRERVTGAELEANLALGTARLCLGQLQPAVQDLKRALELYDPERQRAHRFVYQQDAYVLAQTYLGWALWVLGYPDQALARVEAALQVARRVGEAYNEAIALFNVGLIHQWRREGRAAQDFAEALLGLCAQHGFIFLLAAGTELLGAALVQQGDVARGLELIRQGWAAHQATGAALGGTYWRAVLAEACLHAGQFDEAGRVLVEALAFCREHSEVVWQSELYRLLGELCEQAPERVPVLLDMSPRELDPERLYVHALELARSIGAKTHELRASTSLGRLWARQGDHARGRQLLAEVCLRFDEGQETLDLREAREFS
jgi:DNA-binding winged helix-turn-helix (wHTH) protein/tetratricopeptide (TPR) repeat protein